VGTWEFAYEYDQGGAAHWAWRHLTDDGKCVAESSGSLRTLGACFADAKLHGYRGGADRAPGRASDSVAEGC
jgi:hypothetical protein